MTQFFAPAGGPTIGAIERHLLHTLAEFGPCTTTQLWGSAQGRHSEETVRLAVAALVRGGYLVRSAWQYKPLLSMGRTIIHASGRAVWALTAFGEQAHRHY